MKRFFISLFIGLFSIHANAHKAPAIAVYNVDSVMIMLPEYAVAVRECSKYDSMMHIEDSLVEAAYVQKIIEYGADSSKYSPLLRELKKREIVQLGERIQAFREQVALEREEKKKNLRQPMEKKIAAAAAAIGKEKGCLFVICTEGYHRRIFLFDDYDNESNMRSIIPGTSLLNEPASEPITYRDSSVVTLNITALLVEKLKQP